MGNSDNENPWPCGKCGEVVAADRVSCPRCESETVLQEAERLINGNRNDAYGAAKTAFEGYAAVWSVIIGAKVTAEQVALCMAGLKLCREAHRSHRDNLVDGAGYFGLAAKIVDA